MSLQVRRGVSLVGGIALLGMGTTLLLGSLAGWITDEGWVLRFGDRNLRLDAVSSVRLAGIVAGLATIRWGLIELTSIGKDARRILVRLLTAVGGGGVVAVLFVDLAGWGWPGFGRFQLLGLALAAGSLVAAAMLTRTRRQPSAPPTHVALFVAMALSLVLGAWLLVGGWSADGGRYVDRRSTGRSWDTLLLALPFASAGIYLSYARWKVRTSRAEERLDDAQDQFWAAQQAARSE